VSDRDGYEPGVPCWVDTLQPDPEAARAFYAAVFGWEFSELEHRTDGDGRYFVGRLRGRDAAGVGSAPPGGELPGWNMHVWVDSAAEAAARVRAAGGEVLADELDFAPAGRMAVLADPAGATFCAWEAGRQRGAQVVNEPGAWAMSQLLTPDTDGAAAFYGSVFGWTTEAFGPATLFRRPGYVGGEPQQPVSREVIAAMAPADGPPRWSADFWVHDTDAAAATAEARGGSVIAPPSNSPVGSTAMLADPYGVAFTVSRVVPPA
jgi:predicted enzyme related to lactoylglutathione lyase